MKHRIKPLTYLIADMVNCRPTLVNGYAVDSGMAARIAVHKRRNGSWIADDYDTGYCIGWENEDMQACIGEAVAKVQRHLASGAYARAQASAIDAMRRIEGFSHALKEQ